MAHESPKRIRNVALVGHRGSGKTSVNEALLFTAGTINRLGSVADGTTVSDSAPDEKAREMSISASFSSFRWADRKINLIDTPGEPSFVADSLCALRVCEGAVFVVNGVMGAEVTTSRLWQRASDLGLARILFVNMLDRERADFFRSLDSLKAAFGQHVVATEIPIGSEHELEGVIDLIDMKAYRYDGDGRENCSEMPIPDDLADRAQEMREKLMDEVAEVSDELMERYLEGEEISHEETVAALKTGVTEGHLFPVTCGAATRNLGINRLLDAFVEDLPSPAKRGTIDLDGVSLEPDEYEGRGRVRVQDARRPLRRAAEPVPRLPGRAGPRLARVQLPRAREGADRSAAGASGQGHRARRRVRPRRHRRRRQAQGDACRGRPGGRRRGHPAGAARHAPPRDGVRDRGEGQGRRGEDGSGPAPPPGGGPHDRLPPRRADRRADPGRDHADPRGGDRRAHEGALRRGGRAAPAARALSRGDQGQRQGARALQEADRRARAVRRLPHRDRAARARRGVRVRQRDQGRRDPGRLHSGGREGRARRDAGGRGRRLPGAGRAGAAVRRPAPLGRLVGDGVQDRRLDGLQGRHGERPGVPDGADHDRHA